MNIDIVGQQTIELVREVGQFIREEQTKFGREDIQYKGKNDLVTYVDNTAEQRLVKGLDKIVPEAGFITEEETLDREGEIYEWIIDPLDGTMNFVNRLPLYAVSVALRQNETTVLGVIYEVSLDECFYAWDGQPPHLNQQAITVNQRENLSIDDAVLATGFPYDHENVRSEYLELFTRLLRSAQGVRRLGSAAVDLAYVACGRFEGFYEYNLNPWDVAAGAYIVQQAQGTVSDFSGDENYLFGQEIIAACPSVYSDLLEYVQGYMKKKQLKK